jgi:DNA-binding transcriptional LysR family regulator
MEILELDIKLLVIFEQIIQEQNATRVAKNLGISQPSVSYAIKRLRKIFNDQLFVLTTQGFMPTAKACYLYNGITDVLTRLREDVLTEYPFSHLSSERTFRIAMTDYFQHALLPGFLRSVKMTAPNISFDIISLSDNRRSPIYQKNREYIQKELRENKIDLIFDTTLDSYDIFNYRKIISDEWCIVAPTNLKESALNNDSDQLQCVTLHENGDQEGLKQFKTLISVDNYAAIAPVITSTNCVARVPQRVARHMSQTFNTCILHPSQTNDTLYGYQLWSNSTGNAPDHKWLRHAIISYCENI